MDEQQQLEIITKARLLWDSGDPYEAGQVIFEHIPVPERRYWAADIVEVVYPLIPSAPAVDELLSFARINDLDESDPDFRYQFHPKVYGVGALSRDSEGGPEATILSLCYNAAKAICNSHFPPIMFDHDAAWKVVVFAKELSDMLNQPELTEKLWFAISNRYYIQLDEPGPCGPGCPFCYDMYGSG